MSDVTKMQVQRWNQDLTVPIYLDLDGGTLEEHDQIYGTIGQNYNLDGIGSPEKDGEWWFEGWFMDQERTIPLTDSTPVDYNLRVLYAKFTPIDFANGTHFSLNVTVSQWGGGTSAFPIYNAVKDADSKYIFVDWGDGSDIERFDENISQKYHTYQESGEYVVRVSNDISEFTCSYSNSTWYNRIRSLRSLDQTGTKVTSIGQYCFYYANQMTSATFGENFTTINNYAFSGCPAMTTFWFYNPNGVAATGRNTFGRETDSGAEQYCGYTNRSRRTNRLYVPEGYTGYSGNYWSTLTGSNCGFTRETFTP